MLQSQSSAPSSVILAPTTPSPNEAISSKVSIPKTKDKNKLYFQTHRPFFCSVLQAPEYKYNAVSKQTQCSSQPTQPLISMVFTNSTSLDSLDSDAGKAKSKSRNAKQS
ncbi:uncharacterized protein A4U43_C04F15070 [Asparagus officinalis]|uniref:Uncharacterized protein n=1 Tax=Asparagus officinalis TaxID=4686 RepID=A0A5P1F5T6_ASPOF|nr:uncharacterized protein A4U43_C04F15070 [Asparagus officinalis]